MMLGAHPLAFRARCSSYHTHLAPSLDVTFNTVNPDTVTVFTIAMLVISCMLLD